jgi:hypothetical protein
MLKGPTAEGPVAGGNYALATNLGAASFFLFLDRLPNNNVGTGGANTPWPADHAVSLGEIGLFDSSDIHEFNVGYGSYVFQSCPGVSNMYSRATFGPILKNSDISVSFTYVLKFTQG